MSYFMAQKMADICLKVLDKATDVRITDDIENKMQENLPDCEAMENPNSKVEPVIAHESSSNENGNQIFRLNILHQFQ